MRHRAFSFGLIGATLVLVMAATVNRPAAQGGDAPRIDDDDIGGVVTSTKGPEAGVWVIAETTDLPTRMSKTVVTDDRGRYVVPDLPPANYNVWVRGYGLVDSPKVMSAPGRVVNLTATPAPDARAAAEYYPANYWYALLNLPDKSEFPGTGPRGNGIAESLRTQAHWINNVKTTSCTPCHQMGNKATRELPANFPPFASSFEAWDHRLKSGLDGAANMYAYTNRFGRERLLRLYADWTDRIKGGEYPQEAPPRPQGIERNFVITQWDWADDRRYFHDAVASDKRNPAVNANGPVFGVEENASDFMSILDPRTHTATQLTIPILEPKLPTASPAKIGVPSPYWGEEVYWNSKVIAHSNVMDHKGRLWNTSRTRPPAQQPEFCKEGSSHPSAKHFPLNTSGRQYTVYDQQTKKFTIVDTCFGTFHLNLSHDADNTIWSGEGGVAGWVNLRVLDDTGDAQKAQGWAPLVLDTNGNGRQDAWVDPDQPVDPTKDKRIEASFYGIAVSPVDGAVWGNTNAFPGAAIRVMPGPNPPMTTIAEIYEVPYGQVPGHVYNPRGMDVDANGVFWTVLASGHYASFDRRKCQGPLNGPNATGKHCPEGWAFYPVPGPNFAGNPESAAADSNYYNWVDKYDTLGLGRNVPIATGNLSDSLLILREGKWVVLRVPYPMGFFVKQLDGRFDDPRAGWKGRGLWTTSANRTPWHLEGGKGTRPKAIKFQFRPDPLAR